MDIDSVTPTRKYPLIIELILLYSAPGILSSYRRFYLIRSKLTVDSFFAKIECDVRNMICSNYDQVSLFCKGRSMQFSSSIEHYSLQDDLIRVYCLVHSNKDQIHTSSDLPLPLEHISTPSNLFQQFSESIPQFRNFIESHPEIQSALSSPDTHEIIQQLIRNPSRLNDFMMRHDQELRNIESLPGGYSALERLYKDIQEPLQNVFEDLLPNGYDDVNTNQALNSHTDNNAENCRPLDNPWSTTYGPNSNYAGNSSQGSMNYQDSQFIDLYKYLLNNIDSQSPHQQDISRPRDALPNLERSLISPLEGINIQHLEQRFSIQMDKLLKMGFTDRHRNLEALSISNGDLELAVNILLTN